MKQQGTILAMEQALSLTYATLRFVQLGWRVIRLEAMPSHPDALPGDPNRYIGSVVADEGRRSYFVAPNVGKEAIVLNLKSPEGREAVKRIIRALDVDVFCCNTLPGRYKALGIDYDTLSSAKPDLIWAGISAMGPNYPDVAGYDPVMQGMAGYMEVTGDAAGPPMLSGIPLIDLKAGDEIYANVWKAMAEREGTGKGQRIDVSMLQAAASWLITLLPLVDMGCDDSEITRCGNEHRKFVPTNAYPARDGSILMAIGSDGLWQRFTKIEKFRTVASDMRKTNEGRVRDRVALHEDIAALTSKFDANEIAADLAAAKIPNAPIHTIRDVIELPAIKDVLTETMLPGGGRVRMQPKAVNYPDTPAAFAFPPQYGEHTRAILDEAGYDKAEIDAMAAGGIITENNGAY